MIWEGEGYSERMGGGLWRGEATVIGREEQGKLCNGWEGLE